MSGANGNSTILISVVAEHDKQQTNPLPFAQKPIRTISVFLELIRRFEFEFCRRENYFFEGFEFLVRSCECAVACLYPRNSISNVVVSLTVHDNIYTYLFCKMYKNVRDVAKRYETIVEDRKIYMCAYTYTYTYTYTHTYTYTYTYTYTCTCTYTFTYICMYTHKYTCMYM